LKTKTKRQVLCFMALLHLALTVWAAEGYKRVENFSTEDYQQQPQNYCILQDQRGVIYVANNNSLLEYDGVSWRTIVIPNYTVRSLAMDETGRLYVGGKKEIGYLAPEANGELQYVSLMPYLKEEEKNFSSVYQTLCFGNSVWFRTYYKLLHWKEGKFTVWNAGGKDDAFRIIFTWQGYIHTFQTTRGIMRLVKDSFQLMPGSEMFAVESILPVFPLGAQELLIGTRSDGFYRYDGTKAVSFPTGADRYIKENLLYKGITLADENFAITTLRGGVVVIDDRGRWKSLFNKTYGILDDNVKNIFQDSSHNLWLALQNGISKIDYSSPFSVFDEKCGLKGLALSVVRFKGQLYAGTTNGLFYLSPQRPGPLPQFLPLQGISHSCRELLPIPHQNVLIAATEGGVFLVKDTGTLPRPITGSASYALEISRTVPGRIWVGLDNGMLSIRMRNGKWEVEHRFQEPGLDTRSLVEDHDGNLWLGALTAGISKLVLPADKNHALLPRHIRIQHYGAEQGIPGGEVYVTQAAGHITFATSKGLYRFHETRGVIPDHILGESFADGSRGVFRLKEAHDKHIWFHSGMRNYHAITGPVGGYTLEETPFLSFPETQVNAIYPESRKGIVWFACQKGLIRYDTAVKKDYHVKYYSLVRNVGILGQKGVSVSPASSPVLKYRDRNLRLQVAAPFFEHRHRLMYQYRIEDRNKQWSQWTEDSIVEYTDLGVGKYRFRVRAKNVYRAVSEEGTFDFTLLPPWYRTWWAYLLYVAAAMTLMFLVVKWRSRKLEQEKQHLEQIIHHRTREIQHANEKLKEMDQIKSRFFANISHEFRTPLTLIMGPLQQMWNASRGEGQKKKISLVYRNAQRLLGLVEQLLDLAKLESGIMKLQAVEGDIVSYLKGIMEPFELAARQKDLHLDIDTGETSIFIYYDPQKLEKVIVNLLSNAVKFTPRGGSISISLRRETNEGNEGDRPENEQEKEHVSIVVKDNGPGIPAQQLSRIFDRFYQAHTITEGQNKGTGIGLALAREIVELHHGRIEVNSKEGENSGTQFIVYLPTGNSHLLPEEMAENDHPSRDNDNIDIPAIRSLKTGETETSADTGLAQEEEKDIVLVVEDNADLRQYIRDSLEPRYQVLEAGDGKEGIDKAKGVVPDLIVSDIMMPRADGYELCRTIKNHISTSHIPVILLTARAAEENILEGLETGADDYITKPFSTPILLARIKNLIDLRRRLQVEFQRDIGFEPPLKMSINRLDQEFLKDLETAIRQNLSDSDFNVEEMSKRLYISRATLHRKIQALTGETPTDFLRSFRLQRALKLLKSNFGSVTEVAFEVGFTSRAYFTKCFREKFHRLPSDFLALKPKNRSN
jgi:signal transduction histidine kinase/DNA-binding response OmpR family regulator